MTPKEALKEIYNGMSNNIGFVKEFKNTEQALTELEELKKRDTPMKVKVNEILTKDAEHKRYTCPSCDYFFGYICTTTTECNILRDNFCHHCGQRLDWNNESKAGNE